MKKIIIAIIAISIWNCKSITPNSSQEEIKDYNTAYNYYQNAQYSSAITAFSDFISKYASGNNLDGAYYYRGLSWYNTGKVSKSAVDFTNAKSDFEKIITSEPQSDYIDNSYYYRGSSHMNLEKIAMTPASLNTTTANAELLLALSDFNYLLTHFTTSNFRDNSQFHKGLSYYYIADYANATIELGKVISGYPASTQLTSAYYYRGRSYESQGTVNLPATAPASATSLPIEFSTARADYAFVYKNYPASLSADNAMYHHARTYSDEHDCTNEIPAMNAFILAYPNSFYVTSAQNHIATPGNGVCWF
ncbi:MAG: outer membrane protein assembly factor BamD [Spirochaetia bacterium]|nr:outer membrane protein assembly factor BamD [Spirochaetia bacterium]